MIMCVTPLCVEIIYFLNLFRRYRVLKLINRFNKPAEENPPLKRE